MNKYLLPALAVILIFALLSIVALMLWPLYGHAFVVRTDVMYIYEITLDGVETQYYGHDWLNSDSFIIPFIKGDRIEGADPSGKFNVYRWKIEPNRSTEYLILERTNGGIVIVRRNLR